MPAPPASIELTAFICPHCGTYTTQFWYRLAVSRISWDDKIPHIADQELVERVRKNLQEERDAEKREMTEKFLPDFTREAAGEVFVEEFKSETLYDPHLVANLHVSDCYECHQLSVWRYKSLLYPNVRTGPEANADMPADIQRDFNEARTILALSPRGACALLRLSIDKLVTELGAKGEGINDRIGDLVSKGLPEEIQQALDAVRVIGNEAVHPGALDLRDDPETAEELFNLVNVIVDDRISRPKKIKAVYAKVPESKRKAIDDRDKKSP